MELHVIARCSAYSTTVLPLMPMADAGFLDSICLVGSIKDLLQ